jgi:glycosyltransferase involved in cell wall biosynthesis
LGLPEFATVANPFSDPAFVNAFDLVHVHDALEAVPILSMMRMAETRPLAITLHDLSWVTGGCIFPGNCERWSQGCGQCPQLGTWPLVTSIDQTRLLRRFKQRLLQKATLIAPCQWMANQVRSATQGACEPTVIRNAVDLRHFRVRDRRAVRIALGMDPDALVVMVASISLDERRKGTHEALDVLKRLGGLAKPLFVGRRSAMMAAQHPELGAIAAGWIRDREHMGLLFSASDVVLFLSQSDNAPCVVAEAQAAGVPVVAYDVGGVKEMVESGVTGYVSPMRDREGALENLRKLITDRALRETMGSRAADRGRELFGPETFVREHVALYERVLSQRHPKPMGVGLRRFVTMARAPGRL